MSPAIKKGFNTLEDEIMEMDTEKKVLKNEMTDHDQKRLKENREITFTENNY